MIDAIHDGSLLNANYEETPIFKLQVPDKVDGVPSELLKPENMVSPAFSETCCFFLSFLKWRMIPFAFQWQDKSEYYKTLEELGRLFEKNFEKFTNYKVGGSDKLALDILTAGPQLPRAKE